MVLIERVPTKPMDHVNVRNPTIIRMILLLLHVLVFETRPMTFKTKSKAPENVRKNTLAERERNNLLNNWHHERSRCDIDSFLIFHILEPSLRLQTMEIAHETHTNHRTTTEIETTTD